MRMNKMPQVVAPRGRLRRSSVALAKLRPIARTPLRSQRWASTMRVWMDGYDNVRITTASVADVAARAPKPSSSSCRPLSKALTRPAANDAIAIARVTRTHAVVDLLVCTRSGTVAGSQWYNGATKSVGGSTYLMIVRPARGTGLAGADAGCGRVGGAAFGDSASNLSVLDATAIFTIISPEVTAR
eukprot:2841462-Pleurochrysis_carterae.AAC.1